MRDVMIRIEGCNPVHLSDCLQCARCRDVLFPGDDYYSMDGECVCEDCMDAVLRRMRKVVGE